MFARLVALACAGVGPASAGDAEVPANWFGDPFVQVASALPGCPEPAGPRITRDERRVQAHHRAERGTSCYLAGACEKPNAYLYDKDIADQVVARLGASDLVARSTLWVTVQGRVVYLQGCTSDPAHDATELERIVRGVPGVAQAVAAVFTGRGQPAYRVWSPAPGR